MENVDETIGIPRHRLQYLLKRQRIMAVFQPIITHADSRVQFAEESESDVVDAEVPARPPLRDSIVEKLGAGQRREIPRIAIVVRIFRIAANGHGLAGADAGVDAVDGAEGVDDDLEVCEGLAVAGLEGGVVALGIDVEDGDGAEDDIHVLARPAVVDVDVRRQVLPVPKGGVQETEYLRCLRIAAGTGTAQSLSDLRALRQSTMLVLDGEEGRTRDLFPQVEAGLIPVLPDIVEIVDNDRPDHVDGRLVVMMVEQPGDVGHQGDGSQRRSIALGSTPGAGEGGTVDEEFGLGQARSGAQAAGGIGDGLQARLGRDVVLNMALQANIAVDEFVNDGFQGQGGVPRPGVEIIGIHLHRRKKSIGRRKKAKKEIRKERVFIYIPLRAKPPPSRPLHPATALRRGRCCRECPARSERVGRRRRNRQVTATATKGVDEPARRPQGCPTGRGEGRP